MSGHTVLGEKTGGWLERPNQPTPGKEGSAAGAPQRAGCISGSAPCLPETFLGGSAGWEMACKVTVSPTASAANCAGVGLGLGAVFPTCVHTTVARPHFMAMFSCCCWWTSRATLYRGQLGFDTTTIIRTLHSQKSCQKF